MSVNCQDPDHSTALTFMTSKRIVYVLQKRCERVGSVSEIRAMTDH